MKSHPSSTIEELVFAACSQKLDRRYFLKFLLGAGLSIPVAMSLSTQLAEASEIQAANREDLRDAYDFIIVGGGSAGCVVAKRLADSGFSVLLLEAGACNLSEEIIDNAYRWKENTKKNQDAKCGYFYDIETNIQEQLLPPNSNVGSRTVLLTPGKTLGGSGSTNAMRWLRGDQRDYEEWNLADHEWQFDRIKAKFQSIEDYHPPVSPFSPCLNRGNAGPIYVEQPMKNHSLTADFIRTATTEFASTPIEFNCVDQIEGTGLLDHNLDTSTSSIPDYAERKGPAGGYLLEAMRNPDLTIMVDAEVEKINFDEDKICTGVTFAQVTGSESRTGSTDISATREVILSAGALKSPEILMKSGIGPLEDLEILGVDPVSNLSGVGKNLHDHLIIPIINFVLTTPYPEPAYLPITQVNLRTDGLEGTSAHNIHLLIGLAGNDSPHDPCTTVTPDQQINVSVGLVKPKSRGEIRVLSDGRFEVNPNYLGDSGEEDITSLIQGVKWARKFGNSSTLEEYDKTESPLSSSLEGQGNEAYESFVRQWTFSYYHYVGTCAMGTTARATPQLPHGAVVDPQLNVYGVSGLRVVDASVIPTITSVNTHVPTLIIAETAAEQIINTYNDTFKGSDSWLQRLFRGFFSRFSTPS